MNDAKIQEMIGFLRDAADNAQETINYAFGEPYVAISEADAISIANCLGAAGEEIDRLRAALIWYRDTAKYDRDLEWVRDKGERASAVLRGEESKP